MLKATTSAVAILALSLSVHAQTGGGGKAIPNELTIKGADGVVYAGTMDMAVSKRKVTGQMHITKPTEIKGTVAGTAEKGVLKLDFPYFMTERKCQGDVKMDLTIPAKPGPVTGTMEVIGCGRDATNKLTGTVELVPIKK